MSAVSKDINKAKFLSFGTELSKSMAVSYFNPESGWSELKVEDVSSPIFPACVSALHYGQEIFEGMRAWRQKDGGIKLFRPDEHAKRFNCSARRMCLPEISEDVFIRACNQVVKDAENDIPKDIGGSLYLRPVMVGSDPAIGLRASKQAMFGVMACKISSWKPDPAALKLWVSHDMPRAFKGGTGDVKCAGNYGLSLSSMARANSFGMDSILYLDAQTRSFIEEAGAMNIMAVTDKNEIITPSLEGTILPGITRKSVLSVAAKLGYKTVERQISLEEVTAGIESGSVTELFACGTASHVVPIKMLLLTNTGKEKCYDLKQADFPVRRKISKELFDIQSGGSTLFPDWRGDI